jgi:hypothetical protein
MLTSQRIPNMTQTLIPWNVMFRSCDSQPVGLEWLTEGRNVAFQPLLHETSPVWLTYNRPMPPRRALRAGTRDRAVHRGASAASARPRHRVRNRHPRSERSPESATISTAMRSILGRCQRYLAGANRDKKTFIWIADPDRIITAANRRLKVLDSIHRSNAHPAFPSDLILRITNFHPGRHDR